MSVTPATPPPSSLSDSQRLELLLDAVTDYAIVSLDLEGRVTSWNAGAERLHGYSPSEVAHRPYALFFPAEEQASGVANRLLEEARRTGRAEHEGWRLRKDRGRFWGVTVFHPMRDAAGHTLGFAGITRD